MAEIDVAPADELPPGSMKLVVARADLTIGVYNCGGELYAIEDRCSHDDGPLCEGDWDDEHVPRRLPAARRGVRPRAPARPLSLPAYVPVETFPVRVDDGMVKVDVG